DGVTAKANDAPAKNDAAPSQPVAAQPKRDFKAEQAAAKAKWLAEQAEARGGKSDIDTRFDSSAAGSSHNAKPSLPTHLKQSMKPWNEAPEGRRAQLLALEKQLDKAASDKNVGIMAQRARQLLQDTLNDADIIDSDLIGNPMHAMELKRLGMHPSLSARIAVF